MVAKGGSVSSGTCPSCRQNAVSPSWHSPYEKKSPQRPACGRHGSGRLRRGQQKLVNPGLRPGLSFWGPEEHGAAGTWGGDPGGQDPASLQRFFRPNEPLNLQGLSVLQSQPLSLESSPLTNSTEGAGWESPERWSWELSLPHSFRQLSGLAELLPLPRSNCVQVTGKAKLHWTQQT